MGKKKQILRVLAIILILAEILVFSASCSLFGPIFRLDYETETAEETTGDTTEETTSPDPEPEPKPTTPVTSTTASTQDPSGTYCVKAMSGLYLRTAPDGSAKTIVLMPYKSLVEVSSISNGWANVRYGDKTGYCSAMYLIRGNGSNFTDSKAWKKAYLDYVNSHTYDYNQFDLTYIDEDDVPELILIGNSEAAGEIICTYYNGRVVERYFGRLYGTSYILNSGLIHYYNGNNGIFQREVYRLKNGQFNLLLEGEEQICDYYGNMLATPRYYVKGNSCTQDEFDRAFDDVFDQNQAKSFFADAVGLEKVRSKLNKN